MSWWGRAHSCWAGTNCLFSIVCNHVCFIMLPFFFFFLFLFILFNFFFLFKPGFSIATSVKISIVHYPFAQNRYPLPVWSPTDQITALQSFLSSCRTGTKWKTHSSTSEPPQALPKGLLELINPEEWSNIWKAASRAETNAVLRVNSQQWHYA